MELVLLVVAFVVGVALGQVKWVRAKVDSVFNKGE